jgi:hypothetical protein
LGRRYSFWTVDPLRRGIAFDVVERNCRERFAAS